MITKPIASCRSLYFQRQNSELVPKQALIRHPIENNLPELRGLDHIKFLFSFACRQAHSERCNCHCASKLNKYFISDVPHVFTYFRELLPTAQNGTQQID
uniref:Uncharacterized protein n=1 Tax=Candidatus Kentrum sp. FM TaxID=2126340 RepID=A0A450TQH1_9GAMM|nr:MAG: hypothetical protein BECKFM1743C_GA0114222_105542 [Candidatus Kentron sp. FM]VFJ75311.1 MAG: hypothetical protein BECKFM1743A_GA0114220_108242 [Candidatus Kentron sp. FM]VFK18245.1 MAG: hypothetical protein BECKFM1743B_GA0114221_105332 [Candidatus Kentron sp. FM]